MDSKDPRWISKSGTSRQAQRISSAVSLPRVAIIKRIAGDIQTSRSRRCGKRLDRLGSLFRRLRLILFELQLRRGLLDVLGEDAALVEAFVVEEPAEKGKGEEEHPNPG